MKINSKNQSFSTKVLYANRYCDEDGYSTLICGGEDENKNYWNQVLEIKVPSFEVCDFPSMVKPRARVYLVVVNSDIIAIGDVNMRQDLIKFILPVEIYSNKSNSWQLQCIQIDEKSCFCPCFGG